VEGIALLGVFIIVALLLRWFTLHDYSPNAATKGWFAMREPREITRK